MGEQIDDQLANDCCRILMHRHTLQPSISQRHTMVRIVPKIGFYPCKLVEDRAANILLHMRDLIGDRLNATVVADVYHRAREQRLWIVAETDQSSQCSERFSTDIDQAAALVQILDW